MTDLGEPGWEADVLAGQALGGSRAVPPLEALVQAVPNPRAQAQPLGQPGADLADRPQDRPVALLPEPQGAGYVPGPVDACPPAHLEQQGEGLTSIPEVGPLGRGTRDQLVATQVGLLVGGRGAPEVTQERRVVHLRDV